MPIQDKAEYISLWTIRPPQITLMIILYYAACKLNITMVWVDIHKMPTIQFKKKIQVSFSIQMSGMYS